MNNGNVSGTRHTAQPHRDQSEFTSESSGDDKLWEACLAASGGWKRLEGVGGTGWSEGGVLVEDGARKGMEGLAWRGRVEGRGGLWKGMQERLVDEKDR